MFARALCPRTGPDRCHPRRNESRRRTRPSFCSAADPDGHAFDLYLDATRDPIRFTGSLWFTRRPRQCRFDARRHKLRCPAISTRYRRRWPLQPNNCLRRQSVGSRHATRRFATPQPLGHDPRLVLCSVSSSINCFLSRSDAPDEQPFSRVPCSCLLHRTKASSEAEIGAPFSIPPRLRMRSDFIGDLAVAGNVCRQGAVSRGNASSRRSACAVPSSRREAGLLR